MRASGIHRGARRRGGNWPFAARAQERENAAALAFLMSYLRRRSRHDSGSSQRSCRDSKSSAGGRTRTSASIIVGRLARMWT